MNQADKSSLPLITVGPGFFVPTAVQFPRTRVAPALHVPSEAQDLVGVWFMPLVTAYPGKRDALHAALDRWLDQQERAPMGAA